MRTGLLTATALLVGCGSPTLGDLETPSVELSLTARASQPELASVGEAQGGFGVSRVYLSASSLTLIPCRSGAAELMLSARAYELANEVPDGELVDTAVTDLCSIRLDIDPLAENAIEGVPEGASVYVEAAGLDSSFAFAGKGSWSVLLEANESSGFGRTPLWLALDVSTWLAKLHAAATSDPVKVLGDWPLDAVDDDFKASFSLYTDANLDGVLGEDEQTPVAHAVTTR